MKRIYRLLAAILAFAPFLVMGVILLRMFYLDRHVPNYAIEK